MKSAVLAGVFVAAFAFDSLTTSALAQQPTPDQAAEAQFQALATQVGNAYEAVQKLIDSRKKLQLELEALKQPKVSEAPK